MQFIWWGFIFLFMLLHLADTRISDKELLSRLDINNDTVSIHYYKSQGYNIRYADVGSQDKPMVIFIHGAPGSLDAFMDFLNDTTLRKKFRMIAVDRPGYGYSDFGKPLTSIYAQAEALLPLLKLDKNAAKPLLVGHSYGGPIAVEMAMIDPQDVGALQLVGGAVDPDHERIFWINYLLEWPPFKWLLPTSMKVANAEKTTHIAELKKMSGNWWKINMPVTIIQGTDDDLVPLKNAFYAESKLTNAKVTMKIYKNTGHLIPWLDPQYMKKEIMKYPSVSLPLAARQAIN